MTLALVRKTDGVVVKLVGEGRRVEQLDAALGPRLRVDGAAAGWQDGVYRLATVVPLVVPDGKQRVGEVKRAFDPATGKVVESATLEDIPPPDPEVDYAEQIAAALESVAPLPVIVAEIIGAMNLAQLSGKVNWSKPMDLMLNRLMTVLNVIERPAEKVN